MDLTEVISDRKRKLEHQRTTVACELAKLRALEAEVSALETFASGGGISTGMSRTDAIISLLQEASGPLQTQAIVTALNDAGIESSSKDVSSTLHHLATLGRVRREARGVYRAI